MLSGATVFHSKCPRTEHNVKKVKITLQGRIIHTAHRTFEIEVPDEENVQLYDMNAVSELADDAKAVWQVDSEGYVLEDDHTIDSVTDAEESSPATLDTTATGGSARIDSEGTTISNCPLPSSCCARNASFSHASSTSPMPRCTKVVVAPRAPVSSTGTLA